MNPVPFTALSFVVALLILIVGTLARAVYFVFTGSLQLFERPPVRRQWISLGIVSVVAGLCVGYYLYLFTATIDPVDNNFIVAYDALHRCAPREPEARPHTVVLRLDDVQAFGWSELSARMIADAHARDLPIVAGVIPYGLAENRRLVRVLQHHHCALELAIHGYTHNTEGSSYSETGAAEFAHLSYREAAERLALATAALTELFPHYHPTTFIPPQNLLSPSAERALRESGVSVISREGKRQFDYDATTWDFDAGAFVPADEVIATCDAHFARGDDLCTIMLHPQDFATPDGAPHRGRYRHYQLLLDHYASREDVAVNTFAQYQARTEMRQ